MSPSSTTSQLETWAGNDSSDVSFSLNKKGIIVLSLHGCCEN